MASNWNITGNGNWNAAANWNNGVPNAAGDIAIFDNSLTPNNKTITLNIPVTLGELLLRGSGAASTVTFTSSVPANFLTLDSGVAGVRARLSFEGSNSGIINSNILLNSDLDILAPAGASAGIVNLGTSAILTLGAGGLNIGAATLNFSRENQYANGAINTIEGSILEHFRIKLKH